MIKSLSILYSNPYSFHCTLGRVGGLYYQNDATISHMTLEFNGVCIGKVILFGEHVAVCASQLATAASITINSADNHI